MKNKSRKGISLKWRVFAGFAGFALIMLLILWLLQTFFLDAIYRRIKISQINSAAAALEQNIDGDLRSVMNSAAENSGLCVHIYDAYGRPVISAGTRPFCPVQKLGASGFAQLVELASQNNGSYFAEFASQRRRDDISEPEGYLLVRLTDSVQGQRVIAIDTTVTPLDSTVSTVQFTLIITTVLTLAAAAVIAIALARQISGPIERINASARSLPDGKFSFNAGQGTYPEINELAGTLNNAAVEISRTDDLKRELFANVSHDLRTPLTMITGYAEVMRDIPGENSPENLQVIIDEANRLTRLVNDMLDLSRLQSITTFEPVKCSLTALIEEILRRYNKLRETNGYTVEFVHDGEVFVMADELRLSQVIYNLVNNAIDFTGEDKRVTVIQSENDGWVRVEVKDSGEGIPEDKLPYIWDRYYKVDKEHKRSRVGTGLGLSIVKEALTIHGARYGVISGKGGSTFWFEIKKA